MTSQPNVSLENNFTKGFVTEFTGLNFPENASTDTFNCVYGFVGDVTRREGIDLETNYVMYNNVRSNSSMQTYKWDNAGGDGITQLAVVQVGTNVHFYNATNATFPGPLSFRKLDSVIDLTLYRAAGSAANIGLSECQFADGNGYLFIFHPDCDPIYCTYTVGVVTSNRIELKTRDLAGIPYGEGSADLRPVGLSPEHQYNLMNQGWLSGPTWVGSYSAPWTIALGVVAFTVAAGLVGISAGQLVSIQSIAGFAIPIGTIVASATVVSYAGTTLTVNVGGVGAYAGLSTTAGNIFNVDVGYINTFKSTVGVYPSNSDVWWYFKNASDTFDPATTKNQVTLAQGYAPKGHNIFSPFIQDRTAVSGITGLTSITTTKRPTNGAWFQGRVWYTGVNAQQNTTGDATFYSWTSNIYFSQVVQTPNDFGNCYQTNDLTSENLFGLLPTDGGIVRIPEAGRIDELFPTQNGLIVRASNGLWFITGSQGIGFTANDYTVTKLSSVKSISSVPSVNVLGLPYFWNEEGIYRVEPTKTGGLAVNPITVSTILTFYDEIPLDCKKYARGTYNPIDYTIQWVYRSVIPGTFDDNYTFDRILNFNTYNQAFYPHSVASNPCCISGVLYVAGPGGITGVPPATKYFTYYSAAKFSWADEHDTNYIDWGSLSPSSFDSYFVTGYRLKGKGLSRFQMPYVYVFSRSDNPTAYQVQGVWDYAISSNSNRWSVKQLINNWADNFGMIYRRHRIRGQGIVLQIKISSVTGQPFDIIGWSSYEMVNSSP